MSSEKVTYSIVTTICITLAVASAFRLMWVQRSINNAATTITVNEVKPGIYCALATSADGVAIDCWQERQ
jgi:hypothetical protein